MGCQSVFTQNPRDGKRKPQACRSAATEFSRRRNGWNHSTKMILRPARGAGPVSEFPPAGQNKIRFLIHTAAH